MCIPPNPLSNLPHPVHVVGRRFFLQRFFFLATLMFIPACGGIQRPSASVQEVRISKISFAGIDLGIKFEVTNPNNFTLPISRVSYRIRLADSQVASGETSLEATLPAGETVDVLVPITVSTGLIDAVINAVRNGLSVVDYSLDGTLFFALQHLVSSNTANLAIDFGDKGQVQLPRLNLISR